MSATHEELSSFTHRQLRQYTHDDLEKMSLDELVELATIKLDAVEKLPDEKKRPFSKLIDGIKFFLLGIPSVLLYRAIEDFVFETNWEDVLRSVVDLLQSILRI